MSSRNTTDFYIRENTDVTQYRSDPDVIIDKNLLKHIYGVKYVEDIYVPPLSLDWHPRCNSYYPYTEDVDAINRVDHLLAAKKFLESFTTIKKDNLNNFDPYTEDEAVVKYLRTKPATFLILGKPGIGEQQLGKLLADYWKCVYIDPETLIEDEMKSGSRAGQCIEFNLRCGRAISIDVILRLVEKRVKKSKPVEHRGFVICGFPLIRNDMYQDDPVSSVSAVFTAQEIFEEILEPVGESVHIVRNVSETSQVSKENVEEEILEDVFEEEDIFGNEKKKPLKQEPLTDKPPAFSFDEESEAGEIFHATETSANYAAQMNFLFSLCHDPLIIIYLMCQNYDVVTKHEHYRYNLKTNEIVNLMKDPSENIVYTIYTKTPGFDSEGLPDGMTLSNDSLEMSSSDLMYLTYLPCNFSGNVQAQLEQYRFEALPTIEKHVLLHDPQYFIKVDGRLSPSKMFNIVKTKLKVLPLPIVLIPEKLLEPHVSTGAEDEIPDELDYETKTPEECFPILRKNKIVNNMFKLQWSKWGSKCPVSMKKGTYMIGKPQLAVKYFSEIFFLSDEEALSEFTRNPRPYLLPPYPRATCKVMIIGPPTSGKSAVAKCLALLLNGQVLDFYTLQKKYLKHKEKEYLEKIRTDAINEIVQKLNESRQNDYNQRELERQENMKKWIMEALSAVQERLQMERVIRLDVGAPQFTSFPQRSTQMSLEASGRHLSSTSTIDDSHFLKQQFDNLKLSFFYDLQLCQSLANQPPLLEDYMPDELKSLPTPEPVSVFDGLVTEYADKAVENARIQDFQISLDDMEDMYINAIREAEEQTIRAGENHGGWIVDGISPNPELLEIIFEEYKPDNIYVFRDPDYSFLVDRFKILGQNEYKNYHAFFEKVGKPAIAERCLSNISTLSYKTRLTRRIMDDILLFKSKDDVTEAVQDDTKSADEASIQVEFVDEDYFATHATRLAIKKYETTLRTYENDCERLYEYFDDADIEYTEVIVTDKTLEELMSTVIMDIDDKYQFHPHQFSSEERVEEVEDFGEPEIGGEDFDEEIEERTTHANNFMQNRRLGDTNIYCPVAFHDYWVLWKGKEEYTAKYAGKLYLMCNEDALAKFIQRPRTYILSKPVDRFPPPRICVVGVPGCGKTTLAKALAATLGLHYISYDDYLKHVVDDGYNNQDLSTILDHTDDPEVESLINYLESNEPLPPLDLEKIWCEEPKRSVGFVIDGFPRRPCDFEYIENNFMIPDVVLELSTSDVEVNKRYIQKLLEEWQTRMEIKQEKQDSLNREIMDEWEERRQQRIDELMESKRQARYQTKIQDKRQLRETLEAVKEEEEDEGNVTDRSQISYDSVAEEADLEEVRAIVNNELPEPVFHDTWETLEEATERIINKTETNFATDIEFIRMIKEHCDAQLIEWISLDANLSISKVFDQAMRAVDKIKFRKKSLFERCYDVTMDVAEKLLKDGYYLLSRFGRVCPVQLHEKNNSILMYYPLEQKLELFPIIHKKYIYFLAGKKNRDKFVNDPLSYILQSDVNFPIIPFRIAVTGPPKSGKTTLVERFKRDLGLKCISIGQAARYVLRFLPYSRLAKEMEFVLRNGWELTSEMMMKCVEAMAFDGRAITQGVVFDGFPNTRHDVDHLAEIGLVPNLIVHLDANMDDIHLFLGTDKGRKGLPVFSRKFIDLRSEQWFKNVDSFCNWLDKEYQVWTQVQVKPSKWGVWNSTYDLVSAALFEIKYYFKNCSRDMALHLGNMQITLAEFKKRCSCYKHYCPCCLYYDNVLVNGGDPPDRTGLMQFRNHFYWICPKHVEEFANDPESYLPPYNEKVLPGDLPMQLLLESKPNNCHGDGVCIVCYWNGQPERILKMGDLAYACFYREKTYLFDTKKCMEIFINEPYKYFSKVVHFKSSGGYASLKMEDLPVLGMLEQYVLKNVIRAVTNTGVIRPVLAGLGIEKSAAINIALHLKINNPNTPKEFLPLYENAFNLFNERRLAFINNLARMKRTVNPYLHYEEPLERLVLPEPEKYSSTSEDKESSPKFTKESSASLVSREKFIGSIINEIIDDVEYADKEIRL